MVKYDLSEALKNHDKPLTKEQIDNLSSYMKPTNMAKAADGVHISNTVNARVKEINEKNTYWW